MNLFLQRSFVADRRSENVPMSFWRAVTNNQCCCLGLEDVLFFLRSLLSPISSPVTSSPSSPPPPGLIQLISSLSFYPSSLVQHLLFYHPFFRLSSHETLKVPAVNFSLTCSHPNQASTSILMNVCVRALQTCLWKSFQVPPPAAKAQHHSQNAGAKSQAVKRCGDNATYGFLSYIHILMELKMI